MKIRSIVAGVLLATTMVVHAFAAPAYEVTTEAAPNDPVETGIVYGVEEENELPAGSLAGAVVCVGVLGLFIVLPGLVCRVHERLESDAPKDKGGDEG